MTESYLALRTRVDRLATSLRARYEDQMMCGPACCECCLAGLTVTLVEAVAIGQEKGIEEERVLLQAGQPPLFADGLCRFLDSRSLCSIYNSRPLICRTHGLPLKHSDTDAISACEKNFLTQPPHGSLSVDMDNLETALFAANLEYCRRQGLNPMTRVSLDRLAVLIAY